MNSKETILSLQAEIKRLRKLGRVHRLPMAGTIGGTVQRLREGKEMTLSDLANKSKVGRSLMSRIETHPSQNPTFKTLCEIAQGLGIKMSDLMMAWEEQV